MGLIVWLLILWWKLIHSTSLTHSSLYRLNRYNRFQWFELRWLYLDISESELKVLAYFVHWLDKKRQKIFETNSMKISSPNMTSQIAIIRFHSKRGHFWFVFVKLSKIVGFSCVECHSSHKTNFKKLILFYVGTTDFFWKEQFSKFRGMWPLSDRHWQAT